MRTSEKKKRNTTKQPRKPRGFIRKHKNASVFFLLWSIFSLVSLLIVLGMGILQHRLLRQSYRDEAAHEVTRTGKEVEMAILNGPSASFGGDYSGFLHFLSDVYDVQIFIINGQGQVEFPKEPNLDEDAPEIEEHYDFTERLARMKEEIAKRDGKAAVYEEGNSYVYGAEIQLQVGNSVYLYVGKSLSVLSAATDLLLVRTIGAGVFVAVLSFAIQNNDLFAYERDLETISRRYKDYVMLYLLSVIIRRFEQGEQPQTAHEMATDNQLPIRLVLQLLSRLEETDIVRSVHTDKDEDPAYVPAMDTHQITVEKVIGRVSAHGTEEFLQHTPPEMQAFWQRYIQLHQANPADDILISEL